jgi:hypothetical protein
MNTKTLLIAAAALAAGIMSSQAQGVYSQNVVGYVNVPLTEGFNLVATPLDLDGTGTNNTVVGVYSNTLPVSTQIYIYANGVYTTASYAKNKAGTATNWTVNPYINPGLGYWIDIPAGAFGGGASNVTVVGTVLQGALANPAITGAGYNLVGSQVPVAGSITTNLNYYPSLNDTIYTYNGTSYNSYSYAKNKAGTATNWSPSAPNITVGQGFWLDSASGVAWTNNFIVQ